MHSSLLAAPAPLAAATHGGSVPPQVWYAIPVLAALILCWRMVTFDRTEGLRAGPGKHRGIMPGPYARRRLLRMAAALPAAMVAAGVVVLILNNKHHDHMAAAAKAGGYSLHASLLWGFAGATAAFWIVLVLLSAAYVAIRSPRRAAPRGGRRRGGRREARGDDGPGSSYAPLPVPSGRRGRWAR